MITLYFGAHIYTGTGLSAQCFAVKNGRFCFVGSLAEGRQRFPQAKHIDLGGGFVCPGFNDSHMHLLELGCTLMQAQLSAHTGSMQEVMDATRAFALANPQESWVLGRGWNQDYFADGARFPTRHQLDLACPDRPCVITRACGHVAVVNTQALAAAGLLQAVPYIEGGEADRDADGTPNGILRENAISLVTRHIPVPDTQGIKARIVKACECLLAYGITSVQSDDFSALCVPFESIINAYMQLEQERMLPVRVYEQCFLPDMQTLNRFLAEGYLTGWGNDRFRIGPLKLIIDGSLGARTAHLLSPYCDAPQTCGMPTYDPDTLCALVARAHDSGMQIAIHAIGDGAAENAISALEKAQAACPRKNARHGIVHAQVMTPDQLSRMQALCLHAYIQSIFLDYDTQIVHARLGARARHAYPAKTLLQRGMTFSNGSDSPVEPPDVLLGIQCAVTRKSVSVAQDAPYLPEEALTIEQALDSFTRLGAYASFEEHEKGIISPGYLADFTVLDASPLKTDPQSIHSIPVRNAYIGK